MSAPKRKADCTPEEWAQYAAKQREYNRAYYSLNKKKLKAASREYGAAHPEERATACRKWHSENKERRSKYSRLWRDAHKDERTSYMKLWVAENRHKWLLERPEWAAQYRARKNASTKAWHATPNGIASRSNSKHKRRARECGGCTTAAFKAWRDVADKVCFYCKQECPVFHVDHYIPLALGGEHEIHNLRIACPVCNQRKNALHPDIFLARVGVSA